MKIDVHKQMEQRMGRTIEFLKQELQSLRTGRANPSILDRITVNYYGTETPLNQLATVSAPEARMIVIQPYDKSAMAGIEKAILTSDLSLNPNNDGKVIRLNLPMLTEENRRDLTKVAKKIGEEQKIAIRNERRTTNDILKKMEKDKECTEDELKQYEKIVQDITDQHIKEIDEIVDAKMTEIMEV
ncbi:MAG TPA: ribosome recycling factor [Tissierellia bacterium]|nr:ribosome recycling factor [Tissierellia bacterium]